MITREQQLHELLLALISQIPDSCLSVATKDYYISKSNEIIESSITLDVFPQYEGLIK